MEGYGVGIVLITIPHGPPTLEGRFGLLRLPGYFHFLALRITLVTFKKAIQRVDGRLKPRLRFGNVDDPKKLFALSLPQNEPEYVI